MGPYFWRRVAMLLLAAIVWSTLITLGGCRNVEDTPEPSGDLGDVEEDTSRPEEDVGTDGTGGEPDSSPPWCLPEVESAPCNVPEDCCVQDCCIECIDGSCGGTVDPGPTCVPDGGLCSGTFECCDGECDDSVCDPCGRVAAFAAPLDGPACQTGTQTCIQGCRSMLEFAGDNAAARTCIEGCLANDTHDPTTSGGQVVSCADCFWRFTATCGGSLCPVERNQLDCCAATSCADDAGECLGESCGAEIGNLMGCWVSYGDACKEVGWNEVDCFR